MPSVGWAPRIAFAMAAMFFLVGVHMPFWPVWLESRGLSAEWIGLVLGLGGWARVIFNPLVGRWADRSGRGKTIAIVLGVGVVAMYLAFSQARGLVELVVLSVVFGFCMAPLVPLVDAVAVHGEVQGRLNYGRVRRWGSLAFIVASVGMGTMLEDAHEDAILHTQIATAVTIVIALALLPSTPRPSPAKPTTSRNDAPGPWALLRRRDFRAVLLAAGLLQGSHSMLYAFGTKHWRAAGIDESTIGWLWAEGVVAEVVLFSFAVPFARRFHPATMLALGGIGGVLRWPVMAETTSVSWLAVACALHALTFGAVHLGAMGLIRRRIEPEAMTSATSLYSAVALGLAFGIGLPVAGQLYDVLAGRTWWIMAGLSGAGLLTALRLRKRLATEGPADPLL